MPRRNTWPALQPERPARYYWPVPSVHAALARLLDNLNRAPIPPALLSQYLPVQHARVRAGALAANPDTLIQDKIEDVLGDYGCACGYPPSHRVSEQHLSATLQQVAGLALEVLLQERQSGIGIAIHQNAAELNQVGVLQDQGEAFLHGPASTRRRTHSAFRFGRPVVSATPDNMSANAWRSVAKIGLARDGHSSDRWRLSSRPKAKAMQVASPHARQLVRGSNSYTSSGRGTRRPSGLGSISFPPRPGLVQQVAHRSQQRQPFLNVGHLGDHHLVRVERDQPRPGATSSRRLKGW